MNRPLLLLIVTFLCAVTSGTARAADPFTDANAAYAKGDLRGAAAGYERSLKEQGPSASAEYNLANVYFKSGDKGRARLHYERALRLDPRDKDTVWNLEVLSRYLADASEPSPASVFLWPLRTVSASLSAAELGSLFAGGLALWVLAALGAALLPGAASSLGRAAALPLVLCVLAAALIAVRWTELSQPMYVIFKPSVEARYGPSARENKAFELHEGAAARIVDRTEGWVYLALPGGRYGWVPKDSGETV